MPANALHKSGTPHKAIVMARGLGSRMRKEAEGVELSDEQQSAASAGVKAMISVGQTKVKSSG